MTRPAHQLRPQKRDRKPFWTGGTTPKRAALITAVTLGFVTALYGLAAWIVPYPSPGHLPRGVSPASRGIFAAHRGCAPSAASEVGLPVAYFFVNGIRTDIVEDEIDTRALRDALCSHGQLQFWDRVVEFDDPANGPVADRGARSTSTPRAPDARGGDAVGHQHRNVVGNTYGFVADIWTAAREERLAQTLQFQRSWRASRLVGMVTTFLNTGYRVVLVPHSRGTSVTKTAVQALVRQLGGEQASACVAVVAVAPVSRLSWPPEVDVHGLYAAAGGRDESVNMFARPVVEAYQRGFATPSTRELDDSLRARFPVINVAALERSGWSPAQLHSFVDTYLGDRGPQGALMRMLRAAAVTVRNRSCPPADNTRSFARIEPYRDPGELPVPFVPLP